MDLMKIGQIHCFFFVFQLTTIWQVEKRTDINILVFSLTPKTILTCINNEIKIRISAYVCFVCVFSLYNKNWFQLKSKAIISLTSANVSKKNKTMEFIEFIDYVKIWFQKEYSIKNRCWNIFFKIFFCFICFCSFFFCCRIFLQ